MQGAKTLAREELEFCSYDSVIGGKAKLKKEGGV
jgi:hypothetical protein